MVCLSVQVLFVCAGLERHADGDCSIKSGIELDLQQEKVNNKYNDVYGVVQTVTNVSAPHLLPYTISEKNEPSCKAWLDVAESPSGSHPRHYR